MNTQGITTALQPADRQTFLLALSDRLRSFSEPLDVMQAAVEMVGQRLGVNRVGYADIEHVNGVAFYAVGWGDGVLEPITGRLPLTFLGDLLVDFQRGHTVIIPDVDLDPRLPPGGFATIGTRSAVGVPIIRDDAWAAVLFVNHATVRAWQPDEIKLLEDVLERTWDAVERARAEEGRRRLERRQALLYDLILQQRQASTEQAVLTRAARAIGEFLQTDRTGFFELPDDETVVFANCWTAGRLPALEGPFPAIGIGPAALTQVRLGETMVFSDATADAIVAGSVFPEIGTLAGIGAPIVRDGRWQAGLYVNNGEPRLWLADEIALVREVSDLTWDAVERVRAQGVLKRQIRELQISQSRQDVVFDRVQQLVSIVALDGTLLECNHVSLAVIDAQQSDVIGLPFSTTPWFSATPGMGDLVEQGLEAARDGQDTRAEIPLVMPNGQTRTLDFRLCPVQDVGGHVVEIIAAGVDVTELRRTEEALRQSQKMEAVGQLTGGLAHDFNNLLAGISGSLEMMQNRIQQGRFNDVERYMAAAQGASKRAAALTHRLLAFSRRQILDPKPTDVNRLVGGMQEMVQRTVGPGIPVEVVGASGLWPTLVDPSQLENALLNLCINARDAMPDGGRITIETANRWLDERAAKQQGMPEGPYLSLCVTDTGIGMPPEVIARVFEPFFTTKPIGEGTGLGLSMIYGFAKQSGGQVRIYSEVGQGTTVCIYLPRHYGEVANETEAEAVAALPRSEQGETVLVVDDEPTVRMLVTDILEDLGYTAIEAGDSAAGLKVLQSDVRIDLLVTDVGLPGGMNGRKMADAAREARADLKVLFITGYAENALLGNGGLKPGMAVLTKPFAIETMAARIRSMIEGSKEQVRRPGP